MQFSTKFFKKKMKFLNNFLNEKLNFFVCKIEILLKFFLRKIKFFNKNQYFSPYICKRQISADPSPPPVRNRQIFSDPLLLANVIQGRHKLSYHHKQRHKLSYECKIHSYDGRNGHKLSYEFRRTIIRQLMAISNTFTLILRSYDSLCRACGDP